MKRFFKIAWIPLTALAVILIVTLILFAVWRPSDEDEDEEDDVAVSYFSASDVADNDERLTTSYVNNSGTNFFHTGSVLRYELQTEGQTALPGLRSFADAFARRQAAKRTESDAMQVTPSVQGRKIRIVTEVAEVSGKNEGKLHAVGEECDYTGIDRKDGKYWFKLSEGGRIPCESAVRICRNNGFEGTLAHPFTVNVDLPQQLLFSQGGERVYLYFVSDNEFISLFLSGLPAGSAWELYDHNYRKVSADYVGEGGSAEIYRRSSGAQRYLLCVTAGDAAAVTMQFHRDDNEWNKNMITADIEKTYSGVFDYYGDEDFFVVADEIGQKSDELALELGGVDADLQVMAYNRNKQLIGRYTRAKGVKEQIVLYGLQDLYAISIRTVDGKASGDRYSVRFYYMNVYLLGVETYGFKLLKPIDIGENGENYYTAVCSGLSGKRISDVQTAGASTVNITLTTPTGAVFSVKEGEDLPLRVGKNLIKIEIINPSSSRTLTISVTDTNSYGLGYVFITQPTTVRTQPLSSASGIINLTTEDKVQNCGTVQNGFRKVELTDGTSRIGWVAESAVFADYAKTEMPSQYATAIKSLKVRHPNWKFTFVRTGESLDRAVSEELAQAPITDVSGNWCRASESQVRYTMDPANFLNERDIFMFEKQTYHEGTYSVSGVRAIWHDRSEALRTGEYYADCFFEAGKAAGLSPYFITARASIESGNGTSRLARGVSSGYEGYYNFYGINAVDTDPKRGASFAKEHGWNTQRIAIVEGAVWIKAQYVAALQYTPYFIKYSFVPNRKWHQYMTAITAPELDGRQLYEAHRAGGTLDSAIEFVIPVFQ